MLPCFSLKGDALASLEKTEGSHLMDGEHVVVCVCVRAANAWTKCVGCELYCFSLPFVFYFISLHFFFLSLCLLLRISSVLRAAALAQESRRNSGLPPPPLFCCYCCCFAVLSTRTLFLLSIVSFHTQYPVFTSLSLSLSQSFSFASLHCSSDELT